MTLRRGTIICGIGALSLALSACDNGIVAFPGFDERPSPESETVPPQTDTTPTTQTGASDPAPSSQQPVPEGPEPEAPADPPATETTPADDTQSRPSPETPDEAPDTDTPPSDTSDTPLPTEPSADPPAEEETPPDTETPVTDPNANVPSSDPDTADTSETLPPAPVAPAFSYHPPGALTPGSGQGSPDETVYAPDMVFPILEARAFPQSMVFQPGGFRYSGDLPGDECIPENYEYPWRDNFCERGRPSSFKSPLCPAGSGVHLGQDIRVGDGATCQSMRSRYRTNTQSITDYKVVAAEDGIISNISSYTVSLRAGPRTYRYLHMNMRALQVSVGDAVSAGQHLGYVSKDFGFDSNGNRRPTTFHLHFVLKVNTAEGSIFVPPYTSLIESYARREGAPGERLERPVAIASDTTDYDPAEVFEFIE